jgi:hypothetical protein
MNIQESESTVLIYNAARKSAAKVKYFEDVAEIRANPSLYKKAKSEDCGYISFSSDAVQVDTLIAPIEKHSNHNHRIRGHSYRDNMALFLSRPKRGTFLLNLHDVNEVPGSIGFGHKPTVQAGIIPDFYQMNNYNGGLDKVDQYKFAQKFPSVVFAGASTGSEGYNLRENDRVNYCKYVAERQTDMSMCHFYITNVVQMQPQELRRYARSDEVFRAMLHDPVKQEDQLASRYIFSIDGNAAAWDRPMWIMNSNSLLMRAPTKYEMWYSSFLRDGEQFVEVEKENIVRAFNFCEANPRVCEDIIGRAHKFVKDFAVHPHGYEYMHFFLEALNELKAP